MSKGRADSPTRVSEVVLEACSGYETVIFNTCAILDVVISVIIMVIKCCITFLISDPIPRTFNINFCIRRYIITSVNGYRVVILVFDFFSIGDSFTRVIMLIIIRGFHPATVFKCAPSSKSS